MAILPVSICRKICFDHKNGNVIPLAKPPAPHRISTIQQPKIENSALFLSSLPSQMGELTKSTRFQCLCLIFLESDENPLLQPAKHPSPLHAAIQPSFMVVLHAGSTPSRQNGRPDHPVLATEKLSQQKKNHFLSTDRRHHECHLLQHQQKSNPLVASISTV
ncbi:hypothetical protein ACLOJK_012134 [Asimina triloba]